MNITQAVRSLDRRLTDLEAAISVPELKKQCHQVTQELRSIKRQLREFQAKTVKQLVHPTDIRQQVRDLVLAEYRNHAH